MRALCLVLAFIFVSGVLPRSLPSGNGSAYAAGSITASIRGPGRVAHAADACCMSRARRGTHANHVPALMPQAVASAAGRPAAWSPPRSAGLPRRTARPPTIGRAL